MSKLSNLTASWSVISVLTSSVAVGGATPPPGLARGAGLVSPDSALARLPADTEEWSAAAARGWARDGPPWHSLRPCTPHVGGCTVAHAPSGGRDVQGQQDLFLTL